jgi:hypothetical protein
MNGPVQYRPLASKLTNYQPFPDSSITSQPLTHGTAFSRGCRQVVSSRLDPKQKQVRLKTWIQILRKRRAQKTFHWKHREASFHLFSAELFLDHQVTQEDGPTKESSSA